MFKLIRTLIVLAHLISDREAKKQAAKQKAYKAKQSKLASQLRAEQAAAEVKARRLSGEAADANARSALGDSLINSAERDARYLAASLSNYVK